MFFLKRKVWNKNSVEGSIGAQYMYEEVATFCSRYFLSEVDIMPNRAQRNDDMVVEEQSDIPSVFYSCNNRIFRKLAGNFCTSN